MDPDTVIDHLSRLIAICRDGEAAYRSAARTATDRRCRTLFGNIADNRHAGMSALARLASNHGEQACNGGEPAARPAFNGHHPRIGSPPTLDDEADLLRQLRQVEERALIEFSDTLAQEPPIDVRTIVEERYRDVRRAYGALARLTTQGAKPWGPQDRQSAISVPGHRSERPAE